MVMDNVRGAHTIYPSWVSNGAYLKHINREMENHDDIHIPDETWCEGEKCKHDPKNLAIESHTNTC